MFTQRAQNLLAFWGEAYGNPPQISGILATLNQPLLHGTVHQLNRAVVLDKKTTRKVLNAGYRAGRRAFYGEHELVLLRLDGNFSGYACTEMQKSANLEAELRKVLKVRLGTHESTLFESIKNISCSDIIIAHHDIRTQCEQSGKIVSFEMLLRLRRGAACDRALHPP